MPFPCSCSYVWQLRYFYCWFQAFECAAISQITSICYPVFSVILPVSWIEEIDIWGGYCILWFLSCFYRRVTHLTWAEMFLIDIMEKRETEGEREEAGHDVLRMISVSNHRGPQSKLDRYKILNQRNQYLSFISFELWSYLLLQLWGRNTVCSQKQRKETELFVYHEHKKCGFRFMVFSSKWQQEALQMHL